MSVLPTASVRVVLFTLLGLAVSTAVPAQTVEQALERREAAAVFVQPQALALGVLRRECRRLLPGDAGPDAVARAWWERNRDSLDAAQWVIAEAARRYRSQGNAAQAAVRERQMQQSLHEAMLNGLRTNFDRQLPTAATCAQALERFRSSSFDIAKLGSTPGSEAFAEIATSLQQILADPGYRPPDAALRTFEAQVAVAAKAALTQDAVDAAQARGDAATLVPGYESLAADGDAKAAMGLAVLHLNGRLVARNPPLAAGWLYNAWALGDAEGINALGVLWRDGLVGAPDKTLALAAFAIAQKTTARGARQGQGQMRAAGNLTRMMAQSDAAELAAAGCLRWSAVHDAARALAAAAPGLSLVSPPAVPAGTLFDNATLDPKLRGDAACAN